VVKEGMGRKAFREKLTPDQIRTLLDLNVETGELRWTSAAAQGRLTQRIAGSKAGNGYWQIKTGKVCYLAHRIVWAIVHGEWSEKDIDHIDGNRANNALSNLRVVTKSENMQNLAVTGKKTASGLAGACHLPANGRRREKWEATIRINGVLKHLGLFSTPQEAHARYMQEKSLVHTHFSRS
jgi:hypothetical protein